LKQRIRHAGDGVLRAQSADSTLSPSTERRHGCSLTEPQPGGPTPLPSPRPDDIERSSEHSGRSRSPAVSTGFGGSAFVQPSFGGLLAMRSASHVSRTMPRSILPLPCRLHRPSRSSRDSGSDELRTRTSCGLGRACDQPGTVRGPAPPSSRDSDEGRLPATPGTRDPCCVRVGCVLRPSRESAVKRSDPA
jgi:hypothetical protein